MQSLSNASSSPACLCARELLGATPQVMYFLRGSMAGRTPAGLTIPQIRTLIMLRNHPQGSLIRLADYMGVTPPTACRLVDALVKRKLVRRSASSRDRRHICLELTPAGNRILDQALSIGVECLTVKLSTLKSPDLKRILSSLKLIRTLFSNP